MYQVGTKIRFYFIFISILIYLYQKEMINSMQFYLTLTLLTIIQFIPLILLILKQALFFIKFNIVLEDQNMFSFKASTINLEIPILYSYSVKRYIFFISINIQKIDFIFDPLFNSIISLNINKIKVDLTIDNYLYNNQIFNSYVYKQIERYIYISRPNMFFAHFLQQKFLSMIKVNIEGFQLNIVNKFADYSYIHLLNINIIENISLNIEQVPQDNTYIKIQIPTINIKLDKNVINEDEFQNNFITKSHINQNYSSELILIIKANPLKLVYSFSNSKSQYKFFETSILSVESESECNDESVSINLSTSQLINIVRILKVIILMDDQHFKIKENLQFSQDYPGLFLPKSIIVSINNVKLNLTTSNDELIQIKVENVKFTMECIEPDIISRIKLYTNHYLLFKTKLDTSKELKFCQKINIGLNNVTINLQTKTNLTSKFNLDKLTIDVALNFQNQKLGQKMIHQVFNNVKIEFSDLKAEVNQSVINIAVQVASIIKKLLKSLSLPKLKIIKKNQINLDSSDVLVKFANINCKQMNSINEIINISVNGLNIINKDETEISEFNQVKDNMNLEIIISEILINTDLKKHYLNEIICKDTINIQEFTFMMNNNQIKMIGAKNVDVSINIYQYVYSIVELIQIQLRINENLQENKYFENLFDPEVDEINDKLIELGEQYCINFIPPELLFDCINILIQVESFGCIDQLVNISVSQILNEQNELNNSSLIKGIIISLEFKDKVKSNLLVDTNSLEFIKIENIKLTINKEGFDLDILRPIINLYLQDQKRNELILDDVQMHLNMIKGIIQNIWRLFNENKRRNSLNTDISPDIDIDKLFNHNYFGISIKIKELKVLFQETTLFKHLKEIKFVHKQQNNFRNKCLENYTLNEFETSGMNFEDQMYQMCVNSNQIFINQDQVHLIPKSPYAHEFKFVENIDKTHQAVQRIQNKTFPFPEKVNKLSKDFQDIKNNKVNKFELKFDDHPFTKFYKIARKGKVASMIMKCPTLILQNINIQISTYPSEQQTEEFLNGKKIKTSSIIDKINIDIIFQKIKLNFNPLFKFVDLNEIKLNLDISSITYRQFHQNTATMSDNQSKTQMKIKDASVNDLEIDFFGFELNELVEIIIDINFLADKIGNIVQSINKSTEVPITDSKLSMIIQNLLYSLSLDANLELNRIRVQVQDDIEAKQKQNMYFDRIILNANMSVNQLKIDITFMIVQLNETSKLYRNNNVEDLSRYILQLPEMSLFTSIDFIYTISQDNLIDTIQSLDSSLTIKLPLNQEYQFQESDESEWEDMYYQNDNYYHKLKHKIYDKSKLNSPMVLIDMDVLERITTSLSNLTNLTKFEQYYNFRNNMQTKGTSAKVIIDIDKFSFKFDIKLPKILLFLERAIIKSFYKDGLYQNDKICKFTSYFVKIKSITIDSRYILSTKNKLDSNEPVAKISNYYVQKEETNNDNIELIQLKQYQGIVNHTNANDERNILIIKQVKLNKLASQIIDVNSIKINVQNEFLRNILFILKSDNLVGGLERDNHQINIIINKLLKFHRYSMISNAQSQMSTHLITLNIQTLKVIVSIKNKIGINITCKEIEFELNKQIKIEEIKFLKEYDDSRLSIQAGIRKTTIYIPKEFDDLTYIEYYKSKNYKKTVNYNICNEFLKIQLQLYSNNIDSILNQIKILNLNMNESFSEYNKCVGNSIKVWLNSIQKDIKGFLLVDEKYNLSVDNNKKNQNMNMNQKSIKLIELYKDWIKFKDTEDQSDKFIYPQEYNLNKRQNRIIINFTKELDIKLSNLEQRSFMKILDSFQEVLENSSDEKAHSATLPKDNFKRIFGSMFQSSVISTQVESYTSTLQSKGVISSTHIFLLSKGVKLTLQQETAEVELPIKFIRLMATGFSMDIDLSESIHPWVRNPVTNITLLLYQLKATHVPLDSVIFQNLDLTKSMVRDKKQNPSKNTTKRSFCIWNEGNQDSEQNGESVHDLRQKEALLDDTQDLLLNLLNERQMTSTRQVIDLIQNIGEQDVDRPLDFQNMNPSFVMFLSNQVQADQFHGEDGDMPVMVDIVHFNKMVINDCKIQISSSLVLEIVDFFVIKDEVKLTQDDPESIRNYPDGQLENNYLDVNNISNSNTRLRNGTEGSFIKSNRRNSLTPQETKTEYVKLQRHFEINETMIELMLFEEATGIKNTQLLNTSKLLVSERQMQGYDLGLEVVKAQGQLIGTKVIPQIVKYLSGVSDKEENAKQTKKHDGNQIKSTLQDLSNESEEDPKEKQELLNDEDCVNDEFNQKINTRRQTVKNYMDQDL